MEQYECVTDEELKREAKLSAELEKIKRGKELQNERSDCM